MSDDFLNIDKGALDEEWLKQPSLVFKYAKKAAQCKLELDEAKTALDLTKAELDKEIREDPEAFDIEKVTNPAVEAAIVAEDDYQEALAEVSKKKYELDVLYAAVNALEHKKRALESLVSLHGQNYFSTPRAKGSNAEAVESLKSERVAKRTRIKRPKK